MASVRLLLAAVDDLEEAVAWYEARSPRAARRFKGEVAAALARIASTPELYALADDRHRLCPVHRSPYLIAYRYDQTTGEAVVIAVAHGSQDPPAWES